MNTNERMLWAKDLAEEAGLLTLEYFRTVLDVELKGDSSPVTVADRETELFLRRKIEATFPQDAILGEEFGEKAGTTGYQWILDPIDGTKSFIHGIPLYTVLIALLKDGNPILGVVHCPGLKETLWAARGHGAWFNGKPTCVRPSPGLKKAWVHVTDPSDLLRRWPGSHLLLKDAGYCRTWGDAYGYLLVASGRADLMIDAKMSLWDLACLLPIIEEAGGVILDLEGHPGLGDSSVAGSPELVQEALRYLRS